MRRTVLTHLPGLNYFIGTFDLTNFKTWWKSAPLPGDIENIEHALWVGGPMHLCLAKMINGTWSIFLSFDYGVHWQLVKNSVVEIMDIELVTFTWVLYSDANGDWYESTNSGLTWNRVCVRGPVGKAFCVLHKGDNITILSHDGRYIKKSTNIARNWTTACDLNSIVINADEVYSSPHTWTGARIPAIAGANGSILISNGPFMVRSLDNGNTFTSVRHWDELWLNTPEHADRVLDFETNKIICVFPPADTVAYVRDNFLVHDIVVSSIDGPSGGDVAFVVLTKEINGAVIGTRYKRIVVNDIAVPTTGEPKSYPASISIKFPQYVPKDSDYFLYVDQVERLTDLSLTSSGTKRETVTLYSHADWVNYKKSIYVKYTARESPKNRIFKTFSGKILYGSNAGQKYYNFWFKFVYQQEVSLGSLELSSYQLLTPGGTSWDRLLFSAMRTRDSQGNMIIGLKYSTDGGLTYKNINIDEIEIYSGNPDEEPEEEGGAFTYLDYSNLVWVGGTCNNTGYWDYTTGKRIQMMSYDMDILASSTRSKPYDLSTKIVLPRSTLYGIDGWYSFTNQKKYNVSAHLQKMLFKPYFANAYFQKTMSADCGISSYISEYHNESYDIQGYFQRPLRTEYYLSAHVQRPRSKFYGINAIVTDSQADEMLVNTERRIQQLWNLIFPPLPKPVYDSRKDPETD